MRAFAAGGATASSWADGLARLRNSWGALNALLVMLMGLACAPILHAGNETFTYDNAGRLVTVDHGDGRITTYALDPAGNRTNVTTALSGPPGTLSIVTSSGTYAESQGTVNVVIRRSGGTAGAASVNVALTASTSDATVSPANVSWANGDSADKSVTSPRSRRRHRRASTTRDSRRERPIPTACGPSTESTMSVRIPIRPQRRRLVLSPPA
jgi:YD repeat-containing protein